MVLAQSYKNCSRCIGTGVDDNTIIDGVPVPNPCGACGGSGRVPDGWVDVGDLMDKCNDILDKCNDVLERLNE